ncbi:MAG: ATP-binding cassette domain-containing protein [Eubacterium sp.]|nr:ATP-binding cassette domain-containing protein [Eubacterium sp.]
MNREEKYKKAQWTIMESLLLIDNIDDAISSALEVILDVMDSEAGAIWMLDDRKGLLHPMVFMGPIDLSNIYMENGVGIEGVVTATGESLLISDTLNDSRFVGNIFDDQGMKTESLICVPLKAVSKTLGCVHIINRKDGEYYTEADMRLCEQMAALTAMTIEEKGLRIDLPEEKEVMVSLRNVTKEFESGDETLRVLNGINLDIYKNEFVVVLGESGCGKSTMMNIIGGMDDMTGGELIIDGEDFSHPTELELTEYRRHYVGFIFQAYNLMPNLTALENIRFIADISDNPMKPEDALELVGLSDRANNFPAKLSGGQQQRVSIARALVKNPKIILADEPTAALDFKTGQEVLIVLEDVIKKCGTTIVMVTHNVEIAKMANRVIKLRGGKISSIKTNLNPLPAREIVW